jgi:hypothetical protein
MRSAVDKRRHRRVAGAGLSARVRFDGVGAQTVVVENVSMGGALLGVPQVLAPGKNLLVELIRDCGQVVRLVGRVIACTPPVRGRSCARARVRFNPLTPAASVCLCEVIGDLSGVFSIEAVAPSDPEKFEFHERPAPDAEEPIDLVDEVTDVELPVPSLAAEQARSEVAHLAQLLRLREARIVELVRELEVVRRRTRTLEQMLPALPLLT